MIEVITNKDIENMYLETEHGTFTPMYIYETYDMETETYQGFEITKTAEEVYNEWLENKDKPVNTIPESTEQDKRMDSLEEELLTSNLYITDMELKMIELEMKLEALLLS